MARLKSQRVPYHPQLPVSPISLHGSVEATCTGLLVSGAAYMICRVADWPLWIPGIVIAFVMGMDADAKVKAYNNLARHWNRKIVDEEERRRTAAKPPH